MTTAALDPSATWNAFLDAARDKISKHVLDTWLTPVRCVSLEN